jgi:hypothetical protein
LRLRHDDSARWVWNTYVPAGNRGVIVVLRSHGQATELISKAFEVSRKSQVFLRVSDRVLYTAREVQAVAALYGWKTLNAASQRGKGYVFGLTMATVSVMPEASQRELVLVPRPVEVLGRFLLMKGECPLCRYDNTILECRVGVQAARTDGCCQSVAERAPRDRALVARRAMVVNHVSHDLHRYSVRRTAECPWVCSHSPVVEKDNKFGNRDGYSKPCLVVWLRLLGRKSKIACGSTWT